MSILQFIACVSGDRAPAFTGVPAAAGARRPPSAPTQRSPVVSVGHEGQVEAALADDVGGEEAWPGREADFVGPKHLLRRLRRGDHDGVDLPQPQVHHRAVLLGQLAEGCLRLRGEQVVDASDEGEAPWARGASFPVGFRSAFAAASM